MFIQKSNLSSFKNQAARGFFWGMAIAGSLLGGFAPPELQAQSAPSTPAGVGWHLSGTWRVAGKSAPLVEGDAVPPGSLLQPEPSPSRKYINILLPDGQALFYECSTVENCARGFRVPSLYRDPEPFAVDLLARIRAGFHHENELSSAATGQPPSQLPRDEFVSTLGAGNRVEVGGLVSKLPDAPFTYDLQPLQAGYPSQHHIAIVKSGPTVSIALPGPGLFELTFTDETNNPRILMYVAALAPAQASILDSFHRAHQLIARFNEQYRGWPHHELEWAYLESFFPDGKGGPDSMGSEMLPVAESDGVTAHDQTSASDVAAEPVFDPLPGVFSLNQSVRLQCATPGAQIHFTVSGAQPLAHSPIYTAPIIVKGTVLTIKAFSSAPGKRDSPVVTGIFRIRAPE